MMRCAIYKGGFQVAKNKKSKSNPAPRKSSPTWLWLLIIGLLIAGGIIYFIMAGGAKTPTVTNPTYDKDIRPVLQSNCTGCHSPNGVRSDSPLDAYQAVMKYVNPGQSTGSLLAQKIDGGSMSQYVSAGQRDLIKKWIDQGAKEK